MPDQLKNLRQCVQDIDTLCVELLLHRDFFNQANLHIDRLQSIKQRLIDAQRTCEGLIDIEEGWTQTEESGCTTKDGART